VAIGLNSATKRELTMADTTTFTDNLHDQTAMGAEYATEEVRRQGVSFARFGDIGVGNVKAALRLQTEMFDVLHDISRDWVARATSEAEHAFALPNKLGAAHTVPDALAAYHEWLNELMTMASEDHRRFVADSQRIMDKSVRCFAPASPGAAT
jgi:hypothetical protein